MHFSGTNIFNPAYPQKKKNYAILFFPLIIAFIPAYPQKKKELRDFIPKKELCEI